MRRYVVAPAALATFGVLGFLMSETPAQAPSVVQVQPPQEVRTRPSHSPGDVATPVHLAPRLRLQFGFSEWKVGGQPAYLFAKYPARFDLIVNGVPSRYTTIRALNGSLKGQCWTVVIPRELTIPAAAITARLTLIEHGYTTTASSVTLVGGIVGTEDAEGVKEEACR